FFEVLLDGHGLLHFEDFAGYLVRYERVSVPVAAHPRAEAEERRKVHIGHAVALLYLLLELFVHLEKSVEDRLVKVVVNIARLVERGLLERRDFLGLPEPYHLGVYLVLDRLPALLVEPDAPELGK